MNHFTPELLAPAGNLDKLKTAILYGADAVYCAGQDYGLRAAADNFTQEELAVGVQFAHERGSKVYVVLNGFLHDEDLAGLPKFIQFLDSIKVDAVIVSDPGVALLVKEHSTIPLHVSTQASVLNLHGVKAWSELGATRVVLGREVTVHDAGTLQRTSGIEMEMFVHGAMCMAYSGHCVISNFTQGRDSNRGGCAHSCRFSYDIKFEDGQRESSFFMSSKDLEGLSVLPRFVQEGIVSLKVEGRMKSELYAATTTRVYRQALDFWKNHGSWENAPWMKWQEEMRKLPHRDETTASLIAPAGSDSIYDEREHVDQSWAMAGVILAASSERGVMIECRHTFDQTSQLEVLTFKGDVIELPVREMCAPDFTSIEKTKPSSLIRFPWIEGLAAGQVIRLKKVRS
ncbi:MAG: U32 family peptidase [Bacteriovoracaceae bacterium]|nr:U32 family peptidase [Bacteriovoracaceae bacterium]